MEIGRDYPQTMGLKVIAGRGFDVQTAADYESSLLITEKMAGTYSWTPAQALGKRIKIDSTNFTVVGVLKDFHSDVLFVPLEPVALKLAKENKFQYLIVQAKPKDLTAVFSEVKTALGSLYPTKPFNGFYQNRVKAEAYEVTNSIATIFLWFGLVSILLTATGLFALVSLTALKKMKEIALRKVVGASPRHILVLINKSYVLILAVSALLGSLAGLALTRTLINMIFKINSGVGLDSLLWAVIVLFLIAAVTSGIKVWEAVRANPVKLLRSE